MSLIVYADPAACQFSCKRRATRPGRREAQGLKMLSVLHTSTTTVLRVQVPYITPKHFASDDASEAASCRPSHQQLRQTVGNNPQRVKRDLASTPFSVGDQSGINHLCHFVL